ncbi:c-type cytochrome [Marinibacterium sp. SX1]|uniref:c-type cytochrome n=1 Tax=Marinibacterium sp. SX1 TaxID=3388424 RepID=UPI003D180930
MAPPPSEGFDPDLVATGRNLALIGDCRTCHSPVNGPAYSGGVALETPFGTIHSTNITPDAETGIGRWSQAAFDRAMRRGVDREGRHLYPAFPYDHFSRLTDGDLQALYAYVMSLPPVRAEAPRNDLPFPISVRKVVVGWNLLFLDRRPLVDDPERGAEWNRGRYLVEGLGHCSSCHSPRNLAGGEIRSRPFAGGSAEGWQAVGLGPYSTSAIPWTEESLVQYLTKGFAPGHGVALGPMKPVTENLAQAAPADVAAMAHYIANLGDGPAGPGARGQAAAAPVVAPQVAGWQAALSPDPAPALGPDLAGGRGAEVYRLTCASCHDGARPLPLGAMELTLSGPLQASRADNLMQLILGGIPAEGEGIAPIMPGFAPVLGDADLEALAIYLRGRTGAPDWTDLGDSIARVRKGLFGTPPTR